MQWASKRARRRAGDGEFDGDDGRSPKRGTATWRRCRASGDSWSGGEEEGVEAELLSWSGERGVVGDGGYGERRRRWCSAGRERERGRGGESRGRVRESRGEAWRRPGASRRGGEGRQAGREVAWRGGARARRPHSPPSVGTKTTEEGGGLGRLLAGPASWLGCTGRSPGKLLPFNYFLFSNF